MEGEFTGVATLDQQQNLRNSTDFRSVYKTLLEDWLGGDIGGVLPNARVVLEPRADQGLVAVPCAGPRSSPSWRCCAPPAPAAAPAARCGVRASAPRCKGKLARQAARRCPCAGRASRRCPGPARAGPQTGTSAPGGERPAPGGDRGPAAPAAAAAAGRRPALRAGHVGRLRPGRADAHAVAHHACWPARVGVEFNNKYAEDPHDLRIRARHHRVRVRRGRRPARRRRSSVDLAPGTWKLWCNIANHEQRGMVAQITVAAG